MAKRRINPRRRPATMADINRAKDIAQSEAIRYAMAIMLTVLCDKHNASDDELRQYWREVGELSDSVSRGYVSVADLLYTLRVERGIEV